MKYRLFTRGNCPACNEVRSYLTQCDLEFELIDIDQRTDESGHQFVKIVPALFIDDRLMAYGHDIINFLEAKQKVSRSA